MLSVLHGGLKGVSSEPPAKATRKPLTPPKSNILIGGHGRMRVSNLGLTSIALGKYSTGIKSEKCDTVRWPAPEMISGTTPASKQADMYAFGMAVVDVEVCSSFREHHDPISQALGRQRLLSRGRSRVTFPGVHGDLHGGCLQSHEWRTSSSTT